MSREIGRLILGAGVALVLAASAGQARGDCNDARSVTLDIVSGGAATSSDPIEESIITELDASHISVCATATEASGRARVEIRAALPNWQRASIRFESARSPGLERELDVSKLPPEARALAIASATDELVRSALVDSSTVPLEASTPDTQAPFQPPPPAPALEADRAALGRAGRASQRAVPAIELGLGFGASSHLGQREALEVDLMARYWVLRRLPLTARIGVGRRLSRPLERGEVQADGDVHGSLGAGWLFWSDPGRFDLVGGVGLQLSRVGFDERVLTVEFVRVPTSFVEELEPRFHSEENALDHGWALGASLGLEGRAHAGRIGLSLALAGVAPLVGARSDWGDQTSLDAWGVQLHAGVWLALDSTSPNLPL